MNSHLYEFNKKVEQGISLAANDGTYTPTAAVYKESLAYLVKISDSTELAPLTYMPYIQFKDQWSDTRFVPATGIPETYTFRNIHDDNTLELGPKPNTSTANTYTLTLEYYRRIPLVSEEDPLNVLEEVEVPLLYGAQKRFAIHINGPGHDDVKAFSFLESKALKELKALDKRHPDQQQRFRVADFTKRGLRARNRGAMYIRIK